jgi:hypothetical protein
LEEQLKQPGGDIKCLTPYRFVMVIMIIIAATNRDAVCTVGMI